MSKAKKKLYLTVFFFTLLFGILLRMGVFPVITEIERSTELLKFQKKALGRFESRVESFKTFQKDFPLYQPTLDKLEDLFVAEDAPIRFLEFLEKEARDFDLSIKISPFKISQKKEDPWEVVGFSVVFWGKFQDCLRFLERVEKGPFLVEISQLSVEKISEASSALKEFENLQPGDTYFNLVLKTFTGKTQVKKEK
ncbi:MAG: hypothetical protein DRH33_00110 [Candidatus Nealsonbacteria bacterium]|nr:MAG: hypothetical protein DRH33_00110 [Candidatus Nealsonbacteria bacterium]